MKENKWRSLSIMDLAKKGSFSGSSGMAATGAPNHHVVGGKPANPQDQTSASNGQSYELIKSTQVRIRRALSSVINAFAGKMLTSDAPALMRLYLHKKLFRRFTWHLFDVSIALDCQSLWLACDSFAFITRVSL